MRLAAACFLTSTAAFQLNGVAMPHGALPCAARSRVPVPTLGFFDEMKKGFEAGMSPSSSSSSSSSSVDATEESTTPRDSPFGELLKKLFMPEPLTEEERIAQRIRDGEGVVWSGDYSRAWRSKNDMPQDELSIEEAKRISAELSIPLPAEVEADA